MTIAKICSWGSTNIYVRLWRRFLPKPDGIFQKKPSVSLVVCGRGYQIVTDAVTRFGLQPIVLALGGGAHHQCCLNWIASEYVRGEGWKEICQVVILYPGQQQQHILKVICSVEKFWFNLVLDSLSSELFNWVAKAQTWNLSKNLHRRIFRPKILHSQFEQF